MTLEARLLRQISGTGPISLAEFMAEALLDPTDGYYTNRDPLGADGDFTTAPEISQMFGELVGLCLAQCWLDQGSPVGSVVAELGPGRGTLMRDALRATRQIPGFAPDVVLVEASPVLRTRQRETIAHENATWIKNIEDLPDAPLFLIANEFLDALPIRQFQRDGAGWREIHVGAEAGKLAFGLAQRQPQPALNHRLEDTRDGQIVEHCPSLSGYIEEIGGRIARHGGAALIVDYGGWRSIGDTLQAMRRHEHVDPLETPGQADLTAHVDFEAIARSAPHGTRCSAMTPQGVFLERLGITARAQVLARNLTGAALDEHISAHRRLTHPEEMGHLFKVMGLVPESAALPPGLDE